MSPRKLTEDDKNNILQLYRNSEATTSTLAKDFGVSSSTISRFLKNNLSQVEYEELIQQKRLARTNKSFISDLEKPVLSQDKTDAVTTPESQSKIVSLVSKSEATRGKESETETETTEIQDLSQTAEPEKSLINTAKPIIAPEIASQNRQEDEEDDEDDELDVITLEEMLGEEVDDEEEEDDEEEDDDWELETDVTIAYPHTTSSQTTLQILPLTRASFPRTCYVVIDRAAELITRPLKDFADLGSIPQEEIQQKTLPIFDNHRVAKRFSHRKEKVIKVPDGQMLQKTSRYLHSKGITRLLIDGQIYAVSMES